LALALGVGLLLSALIPILAFLLLRVMTGLSRVDAAAVAGHYGSISIVTFVAASTLLQSQGVVFEGWLVAVAAVMEAPAIATALWLARGRARGATGPGVPWRDVMLNGSIVLLLGAFLIGWLTGPAGMSEVEGFLVAPFKGVLCLFLLDMGLVAGRNLLRSRKVLSVGPVLFALLMPLVGASLGLGAGILLGLSVGGVALLATLAASASYIAVPAAMRVALPEANPAVYLTLTLGVTFPFNLAFGISIYLLAAQSLGG
ncbi:MAG: sodium-dependent bicarbonate transport family permease, partial [Wenzhouxiangella sp.]